MPKKSTEIVTVKEFAARQGVSAQSIKRYMETGIITERSIAYQKEGGKPKLIAEYAKADIEKNKDPTAPGRNTKAGLTVAGLNAPRIRNTVKAPQVKAAKQFAEQLAKDKGPDIYQSTEKVVVDGIEIDFSRDPASLIEAKIRQEIAKANEAEIKVKALRGTYVEIDKQDVQLANLATNLKKDLANVPDRLAAPLAAETNPATVRNMIHAEIESILIKHSGPRKVWRT